MQRGYRNNAFTFRPIEKNPAVEQVAAEDTIASPKPIKIGYKGFYKDMSCNTGKERHLYELGVIYEKPEKDKPKPCSADGFHYCNKLTDVFGYYHKSNECRYCEVEVLGNYTDEGDKSVTTKIKVIREIPAEEIEKLSYESNINLPTIRTLQKHNPFLHLGGSAALYLYGIKLSRIEENNSAPPDIDMISPFYHYLVGGKDDKIEQSDSKNSGNDFDEAFYFNGVGVDLRVDPKQKYNLIEHDGFTYKVSAYEIIMQAKLKYALNRQSKHKDDCDEIMGIKVADKKKDTASNLDDLF